MRADPPIQSGVLFTLRLIPTIGGLLAQRGIDPAPLVADAGLPGEALRGEITAPLGRIQRLVERAATALAAPLFGLDLAAIVPAGAYGVSEFLIRSSPTLAHGLRMLCEVAPLINPIGEFSFTPDAATGAGHLHYAVASQRDTLGVHLNEYTIAFILRQLGASLGGALPVAAAWFSHARPDHAAAVAARLGCAVRFQAADCGFTLTREVLARAPRTADPVLFEFLLAQSRAQLARLGPVDIVTQVVHVIEARLPAGDLGAAAIAGAMALTVRSLQRHLSAAGTSLRDVLAHVRRRRRTELRHARIGEADIARQLGFADVRSMARSLDA